MLQDDLPVPRLLLPATASLEKQLTHTLLCLVRHTPHDRYPLISSATTHEAYLALPPPSTRVGHSLCITPCEQPHLRVPAYGCPCALSGGRLEVRRMRSVPHTQ